MANTVEAYCNTESDRIADLLVVKNLQFLKLYYGTITLETFNAVVNKIGKLQQNEFEQLANNGNIPLQHMLRLCDNKQKLEYICNSPRLTMELILDNPNIKWDWIRITTNNAITIQDVDKHSHLPWSWQNMHVKPNITESFIEKYITKDFYFRGIFQNSTKMITHPTIKSRGNLTVSLKFIANHADKFFNCGLSDNEIQEILRNEQKTFAEWNMRNISLVFIMDFYQTNGISIKSPKYFAISNDYIISCIAKY
jgi:hypothetical protein